MKITKEFLKKNNACSNGYDYWVKVNKPSLRDFVDQCKKDNRLGYATWLVAHALDKKGRLDYGIFAAELSLPIFEAKAVLANNTQKNREEAAAAWDAAEEDAWVAWDAAWAEAREEALDAPRAAAAEAAAWDAWAAAAAEVSYDETLWKIIEYGMKLLEKGGK